jgi:hypothetical protein
MIINDVITVDIKKASILYSLSAAIGPYDFYSSPRKLLFPQWNSKEAGDNVYIDFLKRKKRES